MAAPAPENGTNVRVPAIAHYAMLVSDSLAPDWTVQRALDRFLATTRRPPSPAAALFRESGELLSTELDGGRIFARSWGEGPAVLFVHGWNGSVTDFRHLVPAVVNAGFRAIAIDARGHGESDGADGSAIHIARALVAFSELVGPAHAVVAHSLGGPAAAWAVASGAVKADRLVLLAPAGEPAEYIRQLAAAFVGEGFAERMLRATEARLGVAAERIALAESAPRLPQPTLILHDAEDRETPIRPVIRAASAWPSARFVRTDGLGHRRILADARVAKAIVAHLRGTNVRACMHGYLPSTCEACALECELYRPEARPAA